jgi:hypothetical protein
MRNRSMCASLGSVSRWVTRPPGEGSDFIAAGAGSLSSELAPSRAETMAVRLRNADEIVSRRDGRDI